LNIGLIFILLFLVHVSWSLVSPVGSSPDEDTHLNSIYCLSKFDKSPCDSLNERIVNIGKCFYLDSNQPASCDQYVTNKIAPVSRATVETIFYRTLSKFAKQNIDSSVFQMRIINSLIAVLMLIIIYLISPIKIFISAILTWLIVNIPLGFFLVSSINTSSWIISFSILFSVLIYLIYTTSSFLDIKIILAIFIFLIADNTRPDTKLIAMSILVSTLPMAAINLKQSNKKVMFYFLTLVVFFILLFGILTRSKIADLGRVNPIPIWEHLYRITSIPLGVFGGWGLGSLEIDLPALVSVSTNFLILGIIILALKNSTLQVNFSIIMFSLLIYLIPLFVITRSNLQVGEWYQPRYILPLFIPLIFACINSIIHFNISKSSILIITYTVSVISFAMSMHTVVRRYSHGSELLVLNLNSNYYWWWSLDYIPDPMQVILFSITAYSLIYLILFKLIQKVR